MAVYYFMISVLTGLGFVLTERNREEKRLALYLAVTFLCLTFFSSFRYAIGFDYFSYRSIYEITAEGAFRDIMQNNWYEPLFFILCKIISILGMPFQAMIIVVNIFLFSVAVWFIYRYSRIPWMSVYLYITLQFLAYHMNLMRQSIAVAFFLLAYPYLKSRKAMPFFILIFIGGLFHNSLWFASPLYFLLTKKITRKSTGILLALAMAGYFLFDPFFALVQPILPPKYAIYPTTFFWNASSWEYLIPPACYLCLIYLFRKRITDPVSRAVYQNSALCNFLISLFITKHFILERFAVYPFVFSLIAIPDIIASYPRRTGYSTKYGFNNRRVTLLFLLFGGAYFLFAAAKGFHHVYPYISLLDRSLSAPSY